MKNRLVLGLTLILTAAFLISGIFNRSIVPVSITKVSAQEKAVRNSPSPVSSDGEIRLINKIPYKNLPLKIEIKNADKEDLVRELTLTVTNTGDKPIYYLCFTIVVEDVAATGGLNFAEDLYFGRRKLDFIDERPDENDVPLLKGETATLKVSASRVRTFENMLGTEGYRKPDAYKLWFHILNFGDGTGLHTTGALPYPENPPITIFQSQITRFRYSINRADNHPVNKNKARHYSLITILQ